MATLNIGDTAPDFELENQDGVLVNLASFLGKKHLVLYFYPKDETPGCIKEACGFRDQYEAFLEAGAEVVGISADSVESHNLFRLSRGLPFPLLSDPKNKVRKAYGVSVGLFGMMAGRETFVIDKKGNIQFRFSSQIRIDNHIMDALEVLKNIDKGTDK